MIYCSKCGKPDQETDSYCRHCGEFLVDLSGRSSFLTRVFGISNPEKQINLTMTIDLVTAFISGVLLFALMGYFDATEKKTGIPTSPLVFVLYIYMALVAAWQLISFTIGAKLRRKLRASRQANLLSKSQTVTELGPAQEKDVSTVTEQTTRRLEKVIRGRTEN